MVLTCVFFKVSILDWIVMKNDQFFEIEINFIHVRGGPPAPPRNSPPEFQRPKAAGTQKNIRVPLIKFLMSSKHRLDDIN